MKIYTLGHSNRDLKAFIQILKKYNIKVVVDIRRFPSSRKYPWFNREELKEALDKEGLVYIWLGNLLGGYREGGYLNYMSSREYGEGITKLLEIANKYKDATVILCSEKLWFKCHRRFISDTLKSMGYDVIHIIDHERTYMHKGTTPSSSGNT